MIKCVTFDLDDTLWAVNPVVRAANHTMYEWLAEKAPLFNAMYTLRDLNHLKQQVLTAQPEIGYSVTRIRLAVLELGLVNAGYSCDQACALAEEGFKVFHQARQQVEFFEGALETIESLKASGYIVGAISNGNADIRHVGLSHCMDFQFSADQVGVEKPDAEIFQQVLQHTGMNPHEVVHIGDHPEHDVLGAQRVGIRTIWVNLHGRAWEVGKAPDAEIRNLREIPSALLHLE